MYMPFHNIWYRHFYKISILIGILLYAAQLFLVGSNKTNAMIAGHVNVLMGLFLIVALVMNLSGSKPILFAIGLLYLAVSHLLYITYQKRDRIASGHISEGFYIFSTVSMILISLELFVLHSDAIFESSYTASLATVASMVFISILLGSSNWIVDVILYKYITDG